MSYAIDREGLFRGRVKEYDIRKHSSGSVGIYLVVSVDEIWNGSEWEDWRQYNMEVSGEQFVVKKDGSMNQKTVESLMESLGWDGKFASIATQSLPPSAIQFTVKADEWKGQTQYRINFVNPYDHKKGGDTEPVDAASLDARYGAEIRALASTRKRNAAVPSKPMPQVPQTRKAEKPVAASVQSPKPDDIPF